MIFYQAVLQSSPNRDHPFLPLHLSCDWSATAIMRIRCNRDRVCTSSRLKDVWCAASVRCRNPGEPSAACLLYPSLEDCDGGHVCVSVCSVLVGRMQIHRQRVTLQWLSYDRGGKRKEEC